MISLILALVSFWRAEASGFMCGPLGSFFYPSLEAIAASTLDKLGFGRCQREAVGGNAKPFWLGYRSNGLGASPKYNPDRD